jgi:hypothetical protein
MNGNKFRSLEDDPTKITRSNDLTPSSIQLKNLPSYPFDRPNRYKLGFGANPFINLSA